MMVFSECELGRVDIPEVEPEHHRGRVSSRDHREWQKVRREPPDREM